MANPIVYTILMPSYRKAMMSTIACKKDTQVMEESSSTTNATSVSENVHPNKV